MPLPDGCTDYDVEHRYESKYRTEIDDRDLWSGSDEQSGIDVPAIITEAAKAIPATELQKIVDFQTAYQAHRAHFKALLGDPQ